MAKDKAEMLYTIPLYRVYWGRRRNRAPRAVRMLREFAARHFRMDPERVKISSKVNEVVWSKGIERPPRTLQVKIVKVEEDEEEYVYVLLPDEQPPKPEE